MTDATGATRDESEIALECELDADPEKVWRAITIPAFREQWLPEADLAEPEPIASVPGVEVRYRIREDFALESTVTFRIEPSPRGGTRFMVIHRIEARAPGANDNRRPMSLAA
jgi:uncharacterized protein YndB with AHSA1/START domain